MEYRFYRFLFYIFHSCAVFLNKISYNPGEKLSGSVTHSITVIKSGVDLISFDSNHLEISPQAFIISEASQSGVPTNIIHGELNEVLGRKVSVPIPEEVGLLSFYLYFIYQKDNY